MQGNLIGTNKDGAGAVMNTNYGVYLYLAHDNIIGGTVTAARNVISATAAPGCM